MQNINHTIITSNRIDGNKYNPFDDDSKKPAPSNSLPYRECPRFNTCSVNNCPLHASFPVLVVDETDRQGKCTLEKRVRLRISSKYPGVLKWQGLTSREWTGRQRYDAMTTEEKERWLETGLRGLIRAKSKAFQIQRVSGIHEPIPDHPEHNIPEITEPRFTRNVIRTTEEYELEMRP